MHAGRRPGGAAAGATTGWCSWASWIRWSICRRSAGLVPATDQVFKLDSPRSQRCLIEAVASSSCPVVGKTIRDGRFRSLYNAVVIAVARHGERLRGKIGDIVLRAGDTLLLEAHPSFAEQHRNSRDFFLVSRLENSTPPHYERAATGPGDPAGWCVVTSVVTLQRVAFGPGTDHDVQGALVAAGLMLLTRCCRIEQARRSIDWEVLVAIAASFGIGQALQKTGAADGVTRAIVDAAGGSPWWSLAAIYGVTLLVTELITNNAAAALMFPFALATAQNLQANPMPVRDRRDDGRLGRLRHADRLPDEPDGLRPRRLPLHRLPADRRAAGPAGRAS